MNKAEQFSEFLKTVRDWTTGDDGFLYELTWQHGGGSVVLPYSALAEVHPDLPAAVQNMSDYWLRSALNGRVFSLTPALIHAQLSYLTAPFVLPGHNGVRHHIWAVNDVTWNARHRALSLGVMVYSLCTTLPAAQDMSEKQTPPFVISSSAKVLQPPPRWLDRHYSGWQSRLEHTLALGCDTATIATQLFTKRVARAAPISLGDVTFD